MDKYQKARIIADRLAVEYPDADTPLHHSNVFELLMSVMLSPQTTDEVTNQVTPLLFETYSTPEILAESDRKEVERFITRINYYKTKAERLVLMAKLLVEKFDSKVPHTMEELLEIPGVGRKVANVVISEWYGKPRLNDGDSTDEFSSATKGSISPEGFVVDTHVLRVSKRLGLVIGNDPKKVELELMEVFPREEWRDVSLRMIFHGRNRCKARDNHCLEDIFWAKYCEQDS